MSPAALHPDLAALAAAGRLHVVPGRGSVEGGVLDALPTGSRVARASRRHYSRHPFDHASPAHDPGAFERGLSPLFRSLADVLPRDGLVLEVGSGPGHATAWLRSRGVRVVALDQSLESLRRLVSRGEGAAVAADVGALPFADATFAGVVADGVVHHAERPRRALDELVRVLAPGGVLFLRVYRAEALYPTLYRVVGGVLRSLDRQPPLRPLVWRVAMPAYRRAADARWRRRGEEPGRHDEGVFADYFLTPRATPWRGGATLTALRARGLEVLAYERHRNAHGFLARKRGTGAP